MKKKVTALLLCLSMLICTVITTSDNSFVYADSDDYAVIIYSDADWEGDSLELSVGSYDVSTLTSSIGNDTLSSLRVAPGYQVTLYKNSGYSGSSITVTQDVYDLTDHSFNDMVSSIVISECNPVDDTCIAIDGITDETMVSLLYEFAPRIWLASDEEYYPSSVEWALQYMTRYYDEDEGAYCYKITETLSSATSKLSYFYGNLESSRCYSFYVIKDYNNIDLSYWQYCPYNYGKKVMGQEFGNHVSDWEHVTVRLAVFTYDGQMYVKPTLVCFPYHSYVDTLEWSEVSKVSGTNHVIAYSASKSHGMWATAGTHTYYNAGIFKLQDVCSEGTAWDTWEILETYQYLYWWGRAIGDSTWTGYFEIEYQNESSLCGYRWGNQASGSLFGQDILATGPRGPEGHSALYNSLVLR